MGEKPGKQEAFEKAYDAKFQNREERLLIYSRKFLNFIENYSCGKNSPYYGFFLRKNLIKNRKSLVIDLFHISQYDAHLYFEIIKSPNDLIMVFDFSLNKLLRGIFNQQQHSSTKKLNVRFSNSIQSETREIRSLNNKDFNKIVTLNGILVKCGKLIPNLISGFFKCEICGLEKYSFIEKDNLQEPIYCFNCKNFNCFQLLYHRCNFLDTQHLLVGEIGEKNPYQRIHNTLIFVIHDDYINKFKEGDLIRGTGVLRVVPYRDREKKYPFSFVKPFLDILHIKKVCSEKEEKFDSLFISQILKKKIPMPRKLNQKQKQLHSLGQNTRIFRMTRRSFIPNLHGLEVVKSGLLIQLFKNPKIFFQNLNTILIGENLLLESRILNEISEIAPKGFYSHAKPFDPQKLILQVEKKKKTREPKPIPGWIFKRTSTHLCIDGVQNLPGYIFPILRETTNNQIISFAQGGLTYSLETKISLICSLIKEKEDFEKKNSFFFSNFPRPFLGSFDFLYFMSGTLSNIIDKKFAESMTESVLFDRKKKREIEISKLGFSRKGLSWFFVETSKIDGFNKPFILWKEIVKWGHILKRIKAFNTGELTKKVRSLNFRIRILSKILSQQRLSKIIGKEDIRNAIIKISETSKSLEFFLKKTNNLGGKRKEK